MLRRTLWETSAGSEDPTLIEVERIDDATVHAFARPESGVTGPSVYVGTVDEFRGYALLSDPVLPRWRVKAHAAYGAPGALEAVSRAGDVIHLGQGSWEGGRVGPLVELIVVAATDQDAVDRIRDAFASAGVQADPIDAAPARSRGDIVRG
jgi:hypothetical protein